MATGINKRDINMAAGITMCACEPVRRACYADRHKHTMATGIGMSKHTKRMPGLIRRKRLHK